MDGFWITWRELLIAAVFTALLYLIVFFLISRRPPELRIVDLKDRLSHLSEGLALLTKRVDQLEEVHSHTKGAGEAVGRSVYDYAVQYAKEGLLPEEIVGRCGISLSEATLIVTMQKRGE